MGAHPPAAAPDGGWQISAMAPDIAADPVIGGASPGIPPGSPAPRRKPSSTASGVTPPKIAPVLQILRLDPHRPGAAEDQSHKHGFVGVPGNQDLVSRAHGGEDHGLVAAGGAVDQEPAPVPNRTVPPPQSFRLQDRPFRMVKIIQPSASVRS